MSSCQTFLLQLYREKGIEVVREDQKTNDKKENPITEDLPLIEDGRDFAESKLGKNKYLR